MAWYDITGTVADWVMAGVAVYAAANANQWFSQRSHTKGFDKAEQLLSDIDEQYSKTKKYISELHDAFEYLKAVDERTTFVDENKAHDYQMLILNHTFDIQRIDELSENLEMIERWSLFLKDKDIINDVLKKLRDSSVSAFNASSLAKSCIYDAEHIGMDEFSTSFKHFKVHYNDYVKDLAETEQKYLKFKKTKFIDLFQVK
ncbi:TPA: hypothetical protein MYV36_000291 [Klebsiella pneumoniae]|uniref:hypothetical protein n=1 Tax=Enterobacter TaxID=547 RepID=UPI000F84A4DD|nr:MULTISPECIES: hypothetical protein [Enterobacter]HBW1972365.1 hypothetical protein [Klebsiella pneumoniae]MBW4216226.1 hypothetical protein [Enterobacter cloacae subsp. cloacae]RTM73721.1 hypothetical protein EKO03_22130 [Enterobacter quasiroggenkampii]HCB2180255.1 hypothetical protein [Klebsiella pneumoniae]HCB3423927.1 hypothetical protein [Klebsiella pneumoniae]